MAVTYTCDMCGSARDEQNLVRVYGKPEGTQIPSIDICADCQDRPIKDLVPLLMEKAAALRM